MIISITSLKGGVGKSTLTQNLAVCFAHHGYKVCIADADLENENTLRWASIRAEQENLVSVPTFATPEKSLSANIKELAKTYEVVLIDGTPSLDKLSSKIILLADLLLIPIQPSGMDLWATEKFMERYEDAKTEKESDIPAYLILNQFQSNINFNKEVKEVLKETGISLLNQTIRSRIAFREVVVQGKSVIEYKDEKAKAEITALYQEILAILAGNNEQ